MRTHSHNVLIVEDELLIAWDIKEIIEEANIKTKVVKDYNSAIHSLSLQLPSLVLIDVNLGKGKNGIELGKYLFSEFNIPFVYLTSYNDAKSIHDIIETRPRAFITKPFKKVDLLTTVQLAINSNNNNIFELTRFKDRFENDDVTYIIKKVLKYIDDNFFNKVEIDDLVALTKWSKHHFIRTFTAQMGMPPYSYVLNLKIERAKYLILENNTKLESVAFDLGFQSYINFARTFKNYTKYSPIEFRKKKYKHINK